MERRAFERLPANLRVRIFYGNMVYSGKAVNLSAKGMFISTRLSFPVGSTFMVVLLHNKETFNIHVKVRRSVKSNNHVSFIVPGMGVKILKPPKDYRNFFISLESSSKSSFN